MQIRFIGSLTLLTSIHVYGSPVPVSLARPTFYP